MIIVKHCVQLSVLLLISLCILGIQANANPGQPDEQTRLRQLRIKINKTKQSIRKMEAREHTNALELEDIEQKYAKTSGNLGLLSTQINQLQTKLKKIGTQKNQQEKTLESRQNTLANQLRASYRSGRQQQWRLLLSQANPSKMARHMVYYRHLNQARLSQINDITNLLTEIQEAQANTIAVKDDLVKTQHQIETEQQTLAVTRKKRGVILSKLQDEIKDQKNSLSALLKHEKQLQRLITQISQAVEELDLNVINKQAFSRLKGKLPWPVKTYSSYQRRKINNQAQGLIIKTTEGTQVRSVASGRIVFSDWMPGYGLLIIIDHGSSYLTLYAHNQSLKTALGNKVNAGEIIASAGTSGGRLETALYFEIRKRKQQENPLRWLTKSRK